MGNFVEDKGRIGGWIETHTGTAFYPLDPRPEEIKIEDIAHSLAHICRFNGHGDQFYSVAQHSLNVQRELMVRGESTEVQLLGLLHDASEAYISDICRPIKPYIVGYMEIEEKLMNAILEKFHLSHVSWEQVKIVDDSMLALEALCFMPCKEWKPGEPLIDSNPCVHLHDPQDVKKDFLFTFYSLMYAINS